MNGLENETILVVDDAAENIALLSDILGDDYRVIFARDGLEALHLAQKTPQPNLILLDVMMPGMDGYETCRRLKSDLRTRGIPVIFLTAHSDVNNEEIGLRLGAVDYLHKPCHPAIVLQRVRIHLEAHNQNLALEQRVRERTAELEETRLEIIRRLGRAGEYRDNETGMHVIRMAKCCYLLALAAGIPEDHAKMLEVVAPMHDIGKIGIPDKILLKPGTFTAEEREIMRQHTRIGAEIIGEHASGLLRLARSVAMTHHERWDGRGYPEGISGEAIPIEGRIVSICDVYDALTSARPYKTAWTSAAAVEYIASESGGAFDPGLVPRFIELVPEFAQIRSAYSDDRSRFW